MSAVSDIAKEAVHALESALRAEAEVKIVLEMVKQLKLDQHVAHSSFEQRMENRLDSTRSELSDRINRLEMRIDSLQQSVSEVGARFNSAFAEAMSKALVVMAERDPGAVAKLLLGSKAGPSSTAEKTGSSEAE